MFGMGSVDIFNVRESGVRSYCREFPVVFDRAQGSLMWDEDGKEYIDFFAGAGALNYGHNPEKIKEKVVEYIDSGMICHSLDMHTRAKREFLEKLDTHILKPRSLPHRVMFTGPTGTNSVEAALKIARLATGRQNIACFTNGFHGMTLGSLSATGNNYVRSGAGEVLQNVDRYPFDGYFGPEVDTVSMIEKLIDDPSSGYQPPAAFLIETIQAEGGINVASVAWLRRLRDLANKVGSLLIVDDIQVGCGRTGKFFSFEGADIVPDIICLSKSLSGYGFPLAVVLIKPEYDVLKPGQHNGTFRGNNIAFISAAAGIEFWADGESEPQLNFNKREDLVRSELLSMLDYLGPGFSVRGRGLIQGLRCPDGDTAAAISKNAFEKRLIVERCGPRDEVVKLLPAINIDLEILEQGLGLLKEAVSETLGVPSRKTA